MKFLTSFLVISIFSLPADGGSIIDEWLSQPILSSKESQSEIQQFIRRRIQPLKAPKTAEEWRSRSESLRRDILEKVVLRGVPTEWLDSEPKVVWGNVIETGKGYLIRKLRYQALPGLWIPALLYEPVESEGKIPAILNVNGHVGPLGKAIEYEQIRCINIAKRGMLALHPEWFSFGELSGTDYKHNRLAYIDLCGVSGLSVFYLAIERALSVLQTYPKTDPNRLAMTGLSGGGWQTIILSALDTRISMSIPNAGYIGLDYRIDNLSDVGDLEQNPTDLVSVADYTHLTALLAPRPTLLIYNEKDDCCFQSDRARLSVFESVIPFFRLFNGSDDFEFYENKDPGTHNYEKDNREQFYRFINRYFLPQSERVDSEIPSDGEILKPEELKVGLPENNENFFTLANKLMKDLPKNLPPEGNRHAFTNWQAESRGKLREVLRLKPMTTRASVVRKASNGELEATWYKISIGEEWTVPSVAISPKTPNSIVIAFSDKGKTTLAESVEKLVESGSMVIIVEPLFTGENVPARGSSWQYAQMIATVGERPLGIQVGQIGAIIEWAYREYEAQRISLYGIGPTANVIALSAGGLYGEKVERITVEGRKESLKMLIKERVDYEKHPELFCFGLLKEFDIRELIALCAPKEVEIIQKK